MKFKNSKKIRVIFFECQDFPRELQKKYNVYFSDLTFF